MIQSRVSPTQRHDSWSDALSVDCSSYRCVYDRRHVHTMGLRLLSEIRLAICICMKKKKVRFVVCQYGRHRCRMREKMPQNVCLCGNAKFYLPIVVVVVASFHCIGCVAFVLELKECKRWTEWKRYELFYYLVLKFLL